MYMLIGRVRTGSRPRSSRRGGRVAIQIADDRVRIVCGLVGKPWLVAFEPVAVRVRVGVRLVSESRSNSLTIAFESSGEGLFNESRSNSLRSRSNR